MSTILPFLFMLLRQILPVVLKDAGATSTVIQTLVAVVPIVIKEAADLLPMVQNIIGALSKADGVTDDDLALLAILNKQVDAAFEAAVAAKQVEV